MLILKRIQEDVNLIHLVIGPETDLQFDMLGALNLDLQGIIDSFPNHNLPVSLMVTRTDNELYTMQQLQQNSQISGNNLQEETTRGLGSSGLSEDEEIRRYANLRKQIEAHTDEKNEHVSNLMDKLNKQMEREDEAKRGTKEKDSLMDPRGVYSIETKCSACGERGAYIKSRRIPKCGSCLKIDYEVNKKKRERRKQKQAEANDKKNTSS